MKKKILGIPIMALVIGLVVMGGVFAALLTQYVTITGTATVKQAVVFSDDTTSKTYNFDSEIVAGSDYAELFTIKNRAEVSANVGIQTTCDAVTTDCVGITMNHYSIVGFEDTQNTPTATVTVEDLGTQIQWTIDVDETNPAYANGHASFGLVIGDDTNVKYQIHNNDGSDANFPWGTPLVSPYDTDLLSSCVWSGWHSGCVNTEVSTLDWATVTGERDLSINTNGIFVITVDKIKLGFDDFKWNMYLAQDAVFTDNTFGWATPNVANMHTAVVGESITGKVLSSNELFDFIVALNFNVALTPDTFNFETVVSPITN